LLRNGGFEQAQDDRVMGWTSAPQGYLVRIKEGRGDSKALKCENAAGEGWVGASQTITLNRTSIAPLVARGWSKAQEVSGGSDSGYSLYVDLTYMDGTPLWGQTANFRTGSHDWEHREVRILPEKPVRSLTVHCLLRGHSGTAWFDDVSVEEVRALDGALLFEGTPVLGATSGSEPKGPARTNATQDGLTLVMRDNALTSLRAAGQELAARAPSGFLARDVASDSDIYGFNAGSCRELELRLEAEFEPHTNHLVVRGRLSDTSGKDRAVTLLFALPVEAQGWRWGDDIRRQRTIEGRGEFANTVAVRCGATGTWSLYPLAAIYNERVGMSLAIDMAQPAQCRLVYHAGSHQFLIAYDFGLVPETQRFPASAEFRFVIFQFEPKWGFRAAFKKFMDIFSEYFRVRSTEQGLWMPFTDVSKVHEWQDFGFRYHEGNNNVTRDDAHGVLSFRYTEPMTWWMRMPKELPRTPEAAVQLRQKLASGDGSQKRMAAACEVAGMLDESGEPEILFRNEPWCDGAVWSLNPNPALPTATSSAGATPSGTTNGWNAATVHWNPKIQEELYGPGAKGQLDGEYLDSLEGYVTADLNSRREHFRYTSVPLTFSTDTKRPSLFKGLSVFEFEKWIADDVHGRGKLMFANGVPYRFTFLCPWLDVLGTETDWLSDGKYRPVADSQMCLWRTMAGGKPYLLLMNTDYDVFTSELVEKYFQRSLFYGMFPGMFSHNAADNPYWQNPKWYERDRPLFKKYLPLIRRVAQAGWQPVTLATSDNAQVLVERFGVAAGGSLYLTLLNDSDQSQRTELRLDPTIEPKSPGESGAFAGKGLLSGRTFGTSGPGWDITLGAQQAEVIELKPSAR
jgi:hypothetical protein